MKSNYPRSEFSETGQPQQVLLYGLGIAASLHAFFAFTLPAHPASKLAKFVPAGAHVGTAVFLWTVSTIAALMLIWKSSRWNSWDKFKMAVAAGFATTIASFLMDLPTRSSFELQPEDMFALPAGFGGMTIFVLLIAMPIWLVASLFRKREERQNARRGEAVISMPSSIDQESLLETLKSEPSDSVVRTKA
ncbi:MAG TPA: hypothetical protein VK171_11415 [Fimbriimonas sp.]|nr:hypothetical protein [Fimbriimonas sp.]